MATIHEILIMIATLNVQSYRSIFGSQKETKKIPSTEWKIVRIVFCDAKSNYCLLCLKEKYFIINYPHADILLNKRSVLWGCGWQNK